MQRLDFMAVRPCCPADILAARIPNRFSIDCSVVRLMPRRFAAPPFPTSTPLVSRRIRMMCSRSMRSDCHPASSLRVLQFHGRRSQNPAPAHDHHALEHVFELSNITRPGPALQESAWSRPEMVSMCFPIRAECFRTKWCTNTRISPRRSRSGGKLDRKNIEPVEQVLAKVLIAMSC